MIMTLPAKASREAFRELNKSESYAEWRRAAQAYDASKGLDRWRAVEETDLYDYRSVGARINRLRLLRESGNHQGLMHALNEGIHGNMEGIGNARLYNHAHFGTKYLVEDYIREITNALAYLADNDTPSIDPLEKHDFFQRATHCFGRTAMMLSGAGTLLYFHFGVVKALIEENLLPPIISGSSGGAVVAAFIGTRRKEQFLEDFKHIEMAGDYTSIEELLWHERIFGKRISQQDGHAKMAEWIPDLTFQEAYELTGIQINISISPASRHQKPRLLSATTSPTAMIREAVHASCAVPGVFKPVTLAAKNEHGERVDFLAGRQWVDGSLTGDLPLKRLSRLYGVNHTIVSQTNPLVLPFVDANKDPSGITGVARQVGLSVAKNISLATSRIWKRPLSTTQTGRTLVNGFISLASQSYTGDITILPRERMTAYNPVHWLSEKSAAQISALARDGEHSTWPEIERIRYQTMISRELDRIIKQYDSDIMHLDPKSHSLK